MAEGVKRKSRDIENKRENLRSGKYKIN